MTDDYGTAAERLVTRLLAARPDLAPAYEAVVRDVHAEGLDDLAAEEFLYQRIRALIDEHDHAGLRDLTAVLEGEYGADFDVDLVIRGVLPLFGDRVPEGPDPAEALGPKLRAIVDGTRGWRSAPGDAALVERMVEAVPALRPLAEDNAYGDHQDVLSHQFLAEVAQREVGEVEAGRVEEARVVVGLLESLWGGDADEAIAVSFVENLPRAGEPGQTLVGLLGPALRAELERQRRPGRA